jgi:hypothetical protein
MPVQTSVFTARSLALALAFGLTLAGPGLHGDEKEGVIRLDGDRLPAGPDWKVTGKVAVTSEVPAPFLYDPKLGRSRATGGSLRVEPGGSLQLQGNPNTVKPADGWTLEGFVRPDDFLDQADSGSVAPAFRAIVNERGQAVGPIVFKSYPGHVYPWWQVSAVGPNGPFKLEKNRYQGLTHAHVGEWRHLAVVVRGNTIRFHVDHTLMAEAPVGDAAPTPASLTIAGKANENRGENFSGWFCGIRLTPRPLDVHEFLRPASSDLKDVSFRSEAVWRPAWSGYVDARERYSAIGDGKADDTAALNKAMRELASKVPLEFNTLYLPAGEFVVSDTVEWSRFLVVQGAGRERTKIRLKDRSAGFQDPKQPRPVVAASNWKSKGKGGSGSAIASYLFDVTIDTGSGNPGAIGLDYHSNNVGAVENVTIRSGDGEGVSGISMLRPWPGPSLIKNTLVEGFDFGVHITHREYSMTFEHLTLRDQKKAGIRNTSNILAIRKLTTRGPAPALVSDGVESMICLLDSELEAPKDLPAIQLSGRSYILARNVRGAGGAALYGDDNGARIGGVGGVDEHVTGKVTGLFGSPKKSLNLPIEETPVAPEPELGRWTSILEYESKRGPEGDWGPAIQAAIDAGVEHLLFPANAGYRVDTQVKLRGRIKRLFGMMNDISAGPNLKGAPAVIFDGAGTEPLFIDRLDVRGFVHASPRPLVWRHGSPVPFQNGPGCGPYFADNQGGADYRFDHPQKVWIRQWNVESHEPGPCVINGKADLWALGFKTEYESQKLRCGPGSKTEILGAFIYPIGKIPPDRPIVEATDAALSLQYGTSIYQSGHALHIRETKSGVTKDLKGSDVPFFGSRQKMNLYVSEP